MAFIGPKIFPPLGPAGGSSGPSAPTGWDRCTLADKVLPGFARITRGSILLKIDRKPKAGSDGANPTSHGMDPQPIDLEILTFNDEDREALASIIAPVLPRPGKQAMKPVSIDHPSLRVIGVTAVIVMGASAFIVEGPMRAKMTLALLHWLPTTAANATTTPKSAPVRKINNNGPANPAPTQQPGFGQPPASLRP